MTLRWDDPDGQPRARRHGLRGLARVAWRLPALLALVFGGLMILLLLRMIEAPVWGTHRPWTPHVVQFVCRHALRLCGLRLQVTGAPMEQHGALVANHSSWLDIFVLNACTRVYFVSKAEVARWFGIGLLARATGTVFIERNPRLARQQRDLLRSRLEQGHKLLFFPEATSTNGRLVLRFKPTLFDALFTTGARDLHVQPVALHYVAPPDEDRRFYGWWGEMDFGTHLLRILANPHGGHVGVHFLAPLPVADFSDRKELARRCEAVVRAVLQAEIAQEAA